MQISLPEVSLSYNSLSLKSNAVLKLFEYISKYIQIHTIRICVGITIDTR